MKIRKCSVCGINKFIINFAWHNKKEGTRTYDCSSCHNARRRSYKEQNRKYQLWTLYRITPEQFDGMVKKQSGSCALCGRTCFEVKLCVDHDHVKGTVRSLLCKGCNMLVGIYESRQSLLRKIPSYLEQFNEKPSNEVSQNV